MPGGHPSLPDNSSVPSASSPDAHKHGRINAAGFAWDSTGPNWCHLLLVAMVEVISYSKWKGAWFIPQLPPEFAG